METERTQSPRGIIVELEPSLGKGKYKKGRKLNTYYHYPERVKKALKICAKYPNLVFK
jgi:hypothetical protein